MSDDLTELFDRDPLGLTDQDLDRIITRMRVAQSQFELGVKAPKEPKPKASTKTQALLKDLGLT